MLRILRTKKRTNTIGNNIIVSQDAIKIRERRFTNQRVARMIPALSIEPELYFSNTNIVIIK
jgi:hypothetical protein